jgi:hypothetical protein
VEGNPVPHPDDDLELPGQPRRRPSHFRKKRRESTTGLVRVSHEGARPTSDIRHVVRSTEARHKQWKDVINPAPTLADAVLHRPIPPPAPLPSEARPAEPSATGWVEERQRRKRTEDIVGTIALALMVAAMLTAMWLRMTGP